MGKHLVLVGGGHAHMVTLAKLHKFIEKGYHTMVIGPSSYHYYSGMGPGMLGKIYTPEDIRFATKHVVEKQGGTFVSGKAVRVDPEEKTLFLESGVCFPYDVLSFNVVFPTMFFHLMSAVMYPQLWLKMTAKIFILLSPLKSLSKPRREFWNSLHKKK